MNQSYSLSTSSELELEPMHDDSGSDSLSPLNARTATIVVLALSLMLVLGEAVRRKMVEAEDRKEAVEHCRQIIIGLRLYSPDVNGVYPYWIKDDPIKIIGQNKFGPIYASHDPASSNETFRELFRTGACTDEMIFGCPQSPFQPDLNVGTAPSYREAVQKGENHWTMTYDLTDSSPAEYPVIFENPADASVPPRWNAGATGQVKPGRCWKDRAVVVGFNDGSVRWMPLESGPDWVGLKEHVFPASINSSEPTRILQVAQ